MKKNHNNAHILSGEICPDPWPNAASGLALDLWLVGVTATAAGKLGFEFVTKWHRTEDLIGLLTGDDFEERDRWTRQEVDDALRILFDLKYAAELRDPSKHICFREPTPEMLTYLAQSALAASWCRDLKLSLSAIKEGKVITSEEIERDADYFRAKRVWAESLRMLSRICVSHPMVQAGLGFRQWLADNPKNKHIKNPKSSDSAASASFSV